jgi:hypothetical protein
MAHVRFKVAGSSRLTWFLGLSLALCGSCVSSNSDRSYAGPQERPPSMLAYYSYPQQTIEPVVRLKEHKKSYDILRIEFPSVVNVFGSGDIRVDYYVGKRFERRPTVLILPVLSGVDAAATSFADYFARGSVNCAIVHSRQIKIEEADSPDRLETFFRQTVLDNRQVLDYLLTRPDVDPNRIGCVGVSLGGIHASLLAGVDYRLKCVVLVLAGGSMADIALNSREKHLKAYMQYLQKTSDPAEKIHSELEKRVRTDPLRLGPYVDARNTLMFVAAFDQIVPTWTGLQLRRTIGRPKTIYLFAGHYTSFLYMPYTCREALSFVQRKLNVG